MVLVFVKLEDVFFYALNFKSLCNIVLEIKIAKACVTSSCFKMNENVYKHIFFGTLKCVSVCVCESESKCV